MSVNPEQIGFLITLFGAILIVVRWFHRQAKADIKRDLASTIDRKFEEQFNGDSETSIGGVLHTINQRLGHVEQRINDVDKRLNNLEGQHG